MGLVAGIDCSTQSTKVVVVDSDSGAVMAEGRALHEVSGIGGARETAPQQWWTALRDALAQTALASQVDAISIGGQQHGLVVVDGAGQPLRPAMLWNDTRSAPQAERLVAALGGPQGAAALIGSVPVAAFTVTSWMWLREHEPHIARAAAGVCLPHDWLNRAITGVASTDRGDASGTGWWSSVSNGYLEGVLGLAEVGLDPALLPAVLGPRERAGAVSPAAAGELGLRAGIPVGPGTGDNAAAALGLGLDRGELVMSLGTSGTVYSVADHPACDSTGAVAGFADATGRYLPLACTLNCTLAVDWFARLVGLDRDDVSPAGEVTVLPYLDGERTPNLPGAAGSVAGLRHDTDARQLLAAAYEGAVFSLMQACDLVAPNCPDSQEIILIGGGAQGTAWRETVRRLSGRPLRVPDAVELVALGAAVQAAVALEGGDLLDVARRWQTRKGMTEQAVPKDLERLAHLSAAQAAVW